MNRHVTLMERGQSAEPTAAAAPASDRKISAAELERLFSDPDPRQLARTFDR